MATLLSSTAPNLKVIGNFIENNYCYSSCEKLRLKVKFAILKNEMPVCCPFHCTEEVDDFLWEGRVIQWLVSKLYLLNVHV